MNYRMVTDGQSVLLVKQHGLLRLVALSFTRWLTVVSCFHTLCQVLMGRVLKLLIHQSLLEVFGFSWWCHRWCKKWRRITGINSVGLHDLQQRIVYLKLKTMVLALLLPGDEHIDSFVRASSFWSTSTNLLHHPIPRGGNSGKIPIPPCLSFPLRHPGAFLNLPKIARSGNTLTTKNTHTPRKIKILQITPYYQLS